MFEQLAAFPEPLRRGIRHARIEGRDLQVRVDRVRRVALGFIDLADQQKGLRMQRRGGGAGADDADSNFSASSYFFC